jgi:hypothetical protein
MLELPTMYFYFMQNIAMCVFAVVWQLFIVLLCCSELWQFATSGPVRTLVETATGR